MVRRLQDIIVFVTSFIRFSIAYFSIKPEKYNVALIFRGLVVSRLRRHHIIASSVS